MNIFLTLGLIILLILGQFELALGVIAFIPLIIIIKTSLHTGTLEHRLISTTYILGSLICWVVGFLGCLYYGIRFAEYPLVTLISINLVTWGALLGSLIAFPSGTKKYQTLIIESIPEKLTAKALMVTSAIFIIYTLASYAVGGFNARFEVGSTLEVGSSLYFITALSVLQSLVFLFAGTRISTPFLATRNIVLMVASLIGALVLSLAGGREGTLRAIIYFLLGTFYSKVDLKKLKILFVSVIPITLFFIIILGFARDQFADADISTRIQLTYQVLTQGVKTTGTPYDDPLYGLLTRMTEPTGQFVIDGIVDSEEYIGFANLDRVSMLFLPKFLFPGEKKYEDGIERLEKYGVIATEFTSAPITLMADSFERGGFIAVFLISVIASYCLTFIGTLIKRKVKSSIYKLALLGTFGIAGIRIYSLSVLGFINFITYAITRDAILVWLLFRLLGLIKKNNDKKNSQVSSI